MIINTHQNRADLLRAYNAVIEDNSPVNWALFGYDGQSYVLKVVASGEEGADEMVDSLNCSRVMYGFCRLSDPSTELAKFVLLVWQGESAPAMRKAMSSKHVRDVANLFRGHHVTVTARDEDEASEAALLEQLARVSKSQYLFKSVRRCDEDTSSPVSSTYRRVQPSREISLEEREEFWQQEEREQCERRKQELQEKEERQRQQQEEERRKDEEREERLRKQHQKEVKKEEEKEALKKQQEVGGDRLRTGSVSESISDSVDSAGSGSASSQNDQQQQEPGQGSGGRIAQVRAMFERQSGQVQRPLTRVNRAVFRIENRAQSTTKPLPTHKVKAFETTNQTVGNWQRSSSCGASSTISNHRSAAKPTQDTPAESRQQQQQQHNKQQQSNHRLTKVNSENTAISGDEPAKPTHRVTDMLAKFKDMSNNNNNNGDSNVNGQAVSNNNNKINDKPSNGFGEKCSVKSNGHNGGMLSNGDVHGSQNGGDPSPVIKSPVGDSPVVSQPSHIIETEVKCRTPEEVKDPDSEANEPVSKVCNGRTEKQTSSLGSPEPPSGEMNEDERLRFGDVQITTAGGHSATVQLTPEHGLCAQAMYDYQAADDTEITFDPGDIITNIDRVDPGWWQGLAASGQFGLFPANFVELINV